MLGLSFCHVLRAGFIHALLVWTIQRTSCYFPNIAEMAHNESSMYPINWEHSEIKNAAQSFVDFFVIGNTIYLDALQMHLNESR